MSNTPTFQVGAIVKLDQRHGEVRIEEVRDDGTYIVSTVKPVNVSGHDVSRFVAQVIPRLEITGVAPEIDARAAFLESEDQLLEDETEEMAQNAIVGGLTDKERTAWKSALASSEGNGHDFGVTEDIVADLAGEGIGAKAAGALVSNLVQKGLIEVLDTVTTDSGTWTQFKLDDKGFALAGLNAAHYQ